MWRSVSLSCGGSVSPCAVSECLIATFEDLPGCVCDGGLVDGAAGDDVALIDGGVQRQAAIGVVAGERWSQARLSLVVHAGGGLLVLLAATVLAVYKPRGLTRYGYRRSVARQAR